MNDSFCPRPLSSMANLACIEACVTRSTNVTGRMQTKGSCATPVWTSVVYNSGAEYCAVLFSTMKAQE